MLVRLRELDQQLLRLPSAPPLLELQFVRRMPEDVSAYVSLRQPTSAYVSLCQQ
jgi:hypothetical protein